MERIHSEFGDYRSFSYSGVFCHSITISLNSGKAYALDASVDTLRLQSLSDYCTEDIPPDVFVSLVIRMAEYLILDKESDAATFLAEHAILSHFLGIKAYSVDKTASELVTCVCNTCG